jgi:acyl-CoA thioesterase
LESARGALGACLTLTVDPPHRARLEALFRSEPLARLLGFELVTWDGGQARLRWVPGDEHRNVAGVIHGGGLFSLADAALAVASNSWGRVFVAIAMDAQFLRRATPGEPVVAVALERSRSRRTASYLIEVSRDSDAGELVASFQAVVFRTERWHLSAEEWTDEWKATH